MKHEILHVFGKWFKEISTKKKKKKKKIKNQKSNKATVS